MQDGHGKATEDQVEDVAQFDEILRRLAHAHRELDQSTDAPTLTDDDIATARALHADLIGARHHAAHSHRRTIQQHLLELELASRLMLDRLGYQSWDAFERDVLQRPDHDAPSHELVSADTSTRPGHGEHAGLRAVARSSRLLGSHK